MYFIWFIGVVLWAISVGLLIKFFNAKEKEETKEHTWEAQQRLKIKYRNGQLSSSEYRKQSKVPEERHKKAPVATE